MLKDLLQEETSKTVTDLVAKFISGPLIELNNLIEWKSKIETLKCSIIDFKKLIFTEEVPVKEKKNNNWVCGTNMW